MTACSTRPWPRSPAGDQRDARYWVEHTAKKGEQIREEALSRLVEAGILEQQEDRFLVGVQVTALPAGRRQCRARGEAAHHGGAVLGPDPRPRDVVIIALADACGIFRELLSSGELEQARARIDQVRKLDLIGQAMAQTIYDMEMWLAASRIEGRIF